MTMNGRPASLKAAVIGLGVGERHIAGYESDPRCQVVLLCDIDEGRLQEVGARHPGKRLTTDPTQVLEDRSIDVVSIASYDDAHAAQVLAALAAGKHVFVEKPLCLRDEEFEAIDRALLARPDCAISTNFVLRRAPQFRELKQRVEQGLLGRLYFLDGDYNYGRFPKITEGWRGRLPFYSASHGGAIHMVDLMLWLTGGRIVEVAAIGNGLSSAGTRFRYPDMVTALLRFEAGMTAKVSANLACVCPHHHQLAAYGTEGTFIHGNRGGVFYRSRDPQAEVEQLHLPYERAAKADVQRSFVAHILDGTPADVSMAEVLDVMAVSLAIERSMNSHRWEPVRYARTAQ
jgi:predicted dehydrogenase